MYAKRKKRSAIDMTDIKNKINGDEKVFNIKLEIDYFKKLSDEITGDHDLNKLKSIDERSYNYLNAYFNETIYRRFASIAQNNEKSGSQACLKSLIEFKGIIKSCIKAGALKRSQQTQPCFIEEFDKKIEFFEKIFLKSYAPSRGEVLEFKKAAIAFASLAKKNEKKNDENQKQNFENSPMTFINSNGGEPVENEKPHKSHKKKRKTKKASVDEIIEKKDDERKIKNEKSKPASISGRSSPAFLLHDKNIQKKEKKKKIVAQPLPSKFYLISFFGFAGMIIGGITFPISHHSENAFMEFITNTALGGVIGVIIGCRTSNVYDIVILLIIAVIAIIMIF